MKTRNAAVVWGIQGVYLTGWAAAGVIVWLPELVGACLLYLLSSVYRMLGGNGAGRNRLHLGAATDPYVRFVRAMESIRTRATTPPAVHQRRVSLGSVLGRLVWGIVVWYVILWPAGVVRVSPVEVASSLAAIPGLFRG